MGIAAIALIIGFGILLAREYEEGVRKQFYYAVKEMFGEISNCDLTFSWDEILDKSEFAVKVDEIERLYKIYPA